jgi:hypothetical protein
MPGAPRSPLARPASSALARPLTWGYRRNSGGRQKLSPTGFPTRSEGFFQCRAIVPNSSARRASGGLLRLFGFSPEGDNSLPVCVSHRIWGSYPNPTSPEGDTLSMKYGKNPGTVPELFVKTARSASDRLMIDD